MQVENTSPSNIISHIAAPKSLQESIQELTYKIRSRGDLPHASVDHQLNVLNELSTFPLGCFLIQNRGLNGYWTDVLLMHPEERRESGLNIEGQPMGDLEKFFFDQAPTALATQQRFNIFRTEIQSSLSNGAHLASVPCGLMGDLLTLDYSDVKDVTLTGVDIDENSIDYAKAKAKHYGLDSSTTFLQADAWKFALDTPVDVLVSNGLNIYEPDENRVVDLYRQFYQNIKPGGTLITSYLTPPPTPGQSTEWNVKGINMEDAIKQKVLFSDVLGATWQTFTSTEQAIKQLEQAGFVDIEVIPDESRIFPTFIAKRSLEDN